MAFNGIVMRCGRGHGDPKNGGTKKNLDFFPLFSFFCNYLFFHSVIICLFVIKLKGIIMIQKIVLNKIIYSSFFNFYIM